MGLKPISMRVWSVGFCIVSVRDSAIQLYHNETTALSLIIQAPIAEDFGFGLSGFW